MTLKFFRNSKILHFLGVKSEFYQCCTNVDPEYKFYMSSVVMRIPGYNGDMEEPWYWEKFGRDIYEFSYYTDKDGAQWIRAVADMN